MVEDLVKWLQAEADTDDNPMPAVKANRGRLQSVDDLLRVPGGHWTLERLYDVKDASIDEDAAASESRTSGGTGDATWERVNGIQGLSRYLTVFAEDTADPAMRVNVNTASLVVMKALFDANDEDLAETLLTHRREGAEDDTTTGAAPGTSTGGSSPSAADPAKGFYKSKQDLTKVEGMDQDLAKYPRLNFFADVGSPVYSIRVVAKVVRKTDEDTDTGTDEDGARREIDAIYDYREVVQRTAGGFLTLFTERRSDPIYDQ
jgi:DNA uptake protein ComE-like DNA-binding protein